MTKIELITRVGDILDHYTTRVEGNVHYGRYPQIAMYKDIIRLFPGNYTQSRIGWLIPVGIPYVTKKRPNSGERERDEDKRRVINIAYQFGEKLYVHDWYYLDFLGGNVKNKFLYSPLVDKVIQLSKGGWEAAEQLDYDKFVWQLALKAPAGTFQTITNIDFEMTMDIDVEMLNKIGWVVNQVAGRNAFYGIIETGTVKTGKSKKNPKYKWYNKYLCTLDVTGGSGLEIIGILKYGNSFHPHINGSGNLCRNDYGRTIQDRIDKGMITEFFVLMADFLENYNDGSPYFHLPVASRNVASGGRLDSKSKYLMSKIAFNE